MPCRLGTFRDSKERRQHSQAFWIRRDIELSVRAYERNNRTAPGRNNGSFQPSVIRCWTLGRIPGEVNISSPNFGKAQNPRFSGKKFFS